MTKLQKFKRWLDKNCCDESDYGDGKYDKKIFDYFNKPSAVKKPKENKGDYQDVLNRAMATCRHGYLLGSCRMCSFELEKQSSTNTPKKPEEKCSCPSLSTTNWAIPCPVHSPKKPKQECDCYCHKEPGRFTADNGCVVCYRRHTAYYPEGEEATPSKPRIEPLKGVTYESSTYEEAFERIQDIIGKMGDKINELIELLNSEKNENNR